MSEPDFSDDQSSLLLNGNEVKEDQKISAVGQEVIQSKIPGVGREVRPLNENLELEFEPELEPFERNYPNYCLDCGRVAYYSNPDEDHEDHFCECIKPFERNDPNYCLDCGRVAYYSNPDENHEDHFCECLQTHVTTPCKLLEENAKCVWFGCGAPVKLTYPYDSDANDPESPICTHCWDVILSDRGWA